MDGFECDVRMSRDGVPVVIHDATLLRTHKIDQRVHDATADQLGTWGVPTLEEVLRILGVDNRIVLDVKVSPSHLIAKTIAICKKIGRSLSQLVILIYKPLERKPRGVCLLRAVGFTFRRHPDLNGVACKYNGTEANIRCIDDALSSGAMVNLWSPDKRRVSSMIARYADVCTITN